MQSPEGLENTPFRVNIKNDEIFFQILRPSLNFLTLQENVT